MTKQDEPKVLVPIGLISGLNYGSSGCREGFWRLAADIFKEEGVKFIGIVGGLVDFKEMLAQLNGKLKSLKLAERGEAQAKFIEEHVSYFKDRIPKISGVKFYLVTSPAYDGWIGEEIARGLAEKRHDIMLYRPGGDRLEIKQLDQVLGIYAPKKGVWMRGDYFDTPVLRVLKDEIKRGTRGIGDINVVGCLGSAVFNPGDSSDIKRPYLSLPLCYKITETRTAENQIGIRIMKCYSPNLKEAAIVTYSFKDLASEEWALVQAPPDSSKIQLDLVESLKVHGPLTVGQFDDFTDHKHGRENIQKTLDLLVKRRVSKSWPGVFKDEASSRYYFALEWFQKKLEFPKLTCDVSDAILGFGCLHAACKHTDMKFFRDDVPKMILEHDVQVFVGAGDFIEGLKHDLMVKGEVYGSRKYAFNYTRQEQLAAYLVSQVIAKVFMARIEPLLKTVNGKVEQSVLEAEIRKSLLTFLYIPGNHCEWTSALGFNALSVFGIQLEKFIVEDIVTALAEAKLVFYDAAKVVHSKVVELAQNQPYALSSGLRVSLLHPYMSRTKTTSIRPQEMLAKSECQIVIGANFHVAEAVEQWEFEMGQRVCLQVGTIKRRSGFEDTKLKTVDFGVGLLKVCSADKRIKRTETMFKGTPTPNMEEANEAILNDFEKRLGL